MPCNGFFWNHDVMIMHFFRNDLNGLTSVNIQRLQDSPRQNGSNSILSFYASLPSGNGSVPRNVLATIFVQRREQILSVPSVLEDASQSISPANLTTEQTGNKVPISLINLPLSRVSKTQGVYDYTLFLTLYIENADRKWKMFGRNFKQ